MKVSVCFLTTLRPHIGRYTEIFAHILICAWALYFVPKNLRCFCTLFATVHYLSISKNYFLLYSAYKLSSSSYSSSQSNIDLFYYFIFVLFLVLKCTISISPDHLTCSLLLYLLIYLLLHILSVFLLSICEYI